MKVIIDTDPGVDDAMAILSAFNWSEIEIVGMTTLFGNVPVEMATENALILRDLAAAHNPEAAHVPVCSGSAVTLNGHEKHSIADFVHGSDGFGNKRPAELSQGKASDTSAAQFLVEAINAAPGEITILALAACTNVALAMKLDPDLHTKWKDLVILGGAFQVSGNVSPAAEANIMGDPEAADWVMKHGQNVWIVGLDVTHACTLSGAQLRALSGKGKHGTFLSSISEFYLSYHESFYGQDRVFLHDPTAMLAVVRKDLFEWQEGAVVVGLDGALRGKTLADVSSKKWKSGNEWMRRPKVKVALGVTNPAEVSALCYGLMSA